MKVTRAFGTLFALGALTALPACSSSTFGGSQGGGQYRQSSYAPPASYPTPGTPTASNQESVPATPELVRKVQAQLQQNGDYHAQVDGVWGPMTENGVRQWQQAHNLSTTGALDVATLQSMNLSPKSQNDQTSSSTQPMAQPAGSQASATGNGQPSGSNTNDQANGTGSTSGQNYSTAGTHQVGNSYSNNSQPSTPAPATSNTPTTNSSNATGNNGGH